MTAQDAPFSAVGRVGIAAGIMTQQVGREFTVDLIVGLDDAAGRNGQGALTPAVLGSYLLSVGFVPADLEFTGLENGTAAEFPWPPVSTHPAAANAAGYVSIANSQSGNVPRAGSYLVARLKFKPRRRFAASTVTAAAGTAPQAASLASAYLPGPPPAGPALIRFTLGPDLVFAGVLRGDANEDGGVDVADIVAVIGALFDPAWQSPAKDCNLSGTYTVADLVCTVAAVYGP